VELGTDFRIVLSARFSQGLFAFCLIDASIGGMATPTNRIEPRWPALVALFAVGGLRLAIPSFLSFGPDWLLLLVVGILVIPTVALH
jgi:hypothetical protein